MGFVDATSSDAGLDSVDVYSDVTMELDSCLRVRFLSLSIPLLMVSLIVEFLLECFVAQSRWEVVVRQVSVHCTTNLFDGQTACVVSVQALSSTTTEQVA